MTMATMATMSRAAVHESGHVVVAVRLGLPVAFVTLDGQPPDDLPGVKTYVRFVDCPPITTHAAAHDWAVMCLAGHAAERLFYHDVGSSLDPNSHDAAIVEALAARFSPLLVPAGFMIDAAEAAAKRAVERDRTIIGRVAEELMREGTLKVAEILAIMAAE
jgi:hypothetical protein